jgi:hypothetical protein
VSRHLRVLTPLALLVVLLGAIGGCAKHDAPTAPRTKVATAPTPDSPTHALSTFEWSWENRDTLALRDLLTEDFHFVFSQADSAGNVYKDRAMTRDEFLYCVRGLFVGGPGYPEPPAQRIVLYFDASPAALPDGRPGKASPWHQQVRTSVDLTVDTGPDLYRILGYARFFVVRGDSARIPADLGIQPDSKRWYIERWEDETGSGRAMASAAARVTQPKPGSNFTWGRILAMYH